jgi:hypothetical protein
MKIFKLFLFVMAPALISHAQRPQGLSESLRDVVETGGLVVGITDDNKIYRSSDQGLTSSLQSIPDFVSGDELYGIGANEAVVIVGGTDGLMYRTADIHAETPDWDQWLPEPDTYLGDIRSLASRGNGHWAAAGEDGILFSTDNGVSWTKSSSVSFLRAVIWNPAGGNWIAVGEEVILTSPDGSSWTAQPFDQVYFTAVAADGFGNVLAVGEEGAAFISTNNGASFVAMDLTLGTDFRAVAADGNGVWWVAGAGSLLRAEGTVSTPDVSVILDPDELGLDLEPEGLLLTGDAVLLAGVAFVPPPEIQVGEPDSNGQVLVTLLADQTGDELFFTLDDSVPDLTNAYTGPFTLTSTATVTALALRQGIYSPLVSQLVEADVLHAPFRILSISHDAATVTLEQDVSTSGFTYAVEYTENLLPPQTWLPENVSAQSGTGNPLTWTFDAPGSAVRFWRIVIVPGF